ncbi:hypothetical protein [Goodfellowiella coeruleoviolacea]|uniref:Uncharacterized protein n=1 Tax=Goodfellowiella coeruleoviolacea TaxID=334858 RepID=A0AAE3KJM3_9PSEU|nr:hypothetical protein [Goodfellowiella coeruleoviolacea]MCP2169790.1 hypothetical protein [Goodfellowiella coeruleoviolacea]
MDALDWIDELRRRRWTWHYLPSRKAPQLIAAVLRWPECADVVILSGDSDRFPALAYRAPLDNGHQDPFAPPVIVWSYAAKPAWAIRAVLTIAPPGSPTAPTTLLPTPVNIAEFAQQFRTVRHQVIRPPVQPPRLAKGA